MTPFYSAKGLSRPFGKVLLAVLIVSFCLAAPSSAAEPHAIDAAVVSFARPVKAKVQALGLGAAIKISTVFGRKRYRGYITRIDENSFELTDVKTLAPNTFRYSVVNQVSGRRLPAPANDPRKRGVTVLFSMVSRVGFGP